MLFERDLGRCKHVAYLPGPPTCSCDHLNLLDGRSEIVSALMHDCVGRWALAVKNAPLRVGSCVGELSRLIAMTIKC